MVNLMAFRIPDDYSNFIVNIDSYVRIQTVLSSVFYLLLNQFTFIFSKCFIQNISDSMISGNKTKMKQDIVRMKAHRKLPENTGVEL